MRKNASKKPSTRRLTKSEALKRESALADRERIRRRLLLPMSQRLNFLRVRLPGGGSSL
jgi:hypothetical protein